ncbi:hypothetical protein CHLRE_16g693250v5 [Chlamydomonas reinhardtii]|uniref:Uncharacterized protein n=1 Tax=Chlamydomonas reinhardtii TaxID=3055 RepID=A0A2K3CSE0_CHLRE|nr:uncharacterized protein CHLRE_16g693250v5 [Chlamydomonas reinhardtii]PNW71209.1 hypothetical protein CHLRE_16g693250v5 [Chlamydomonas reinhardtii]
MLQAPGGTGASTGAAGMGHTSTRGPQAHAGLAAAAAEGGQVELLELLQLLGELAAPPMSNNDNDQHFIMLGVAYGCPLEVLQRCCERAFGGGAEDGAAEGAAEGAGAGAGAGAGGGGAEGGLQAAVSVRHSRRQQLLLRAATSPTPDWAVKCEWLLLGWGSEPRQWAPINIDSTDTVLVQDLWRHAATQPGYAQRLQWLAARGLPLPNAALEAAGWAGDLAAVEFCLAVEEEAEPVLPKILATAALAAGQVPVLRLLRGRGEAVDWGDLVDAVMFECVCEDAGCSDSPCLPALRYLAMEGGLDKAEEAAVDWSEVFTSVAQHGADLALLRNLHEQRGAAFDPKAVAEGGSEEQLEWAMQLVQQPGSGRVSGYGQVELFEAALEAGNWATADWLYRRGLLGPGCTPQQEQWHLQRVFRDVAGQMGDSSDDSRVVPTLWHLYRWCNMQWSTKCRRALQECAVRAAHLGRLRVVSGQARQTREMLRDADAALAVGRCGGGARRESVVSEEEGSEESEESEE